MTARPCLGCGEPVEASRCQSCQAQRDRRTETRRGTATARGYDATWSRLSARARRRQPFCTDCGAATGLQLDHLPGAWQRVAAGQRLRLGIDVEVTCGPCNRRRGAARGARPRGETPQQGAPNPLAPQTLSNFVVTERSG